MEDNFGPGILGGVVLIDPATNLPYKAVGSGGGGGPVSWGDILGDLNDQEDLFNALNTLSSLIGNVDDKLHSEGTTGNFVAVQSADGSVGDSGYAPEDFATSAQGVLSESAVQPNDLSDVATSGSYNDLTNKPSIPNPEDFATAAQGVLAEAAIPSTEKGAVGGVATLDGAQKLPASQLPDMAVTEFLGEVANQTAMLALSGEKGDWCIRTDTGTVWVIAGAAPSSLGSWRQLSYPTAPVTSVAGRTGIVTLTKTDVSLDLVDNTADSAKPVSGPQATALAGKLPQSLSGDPARFRGVYETAPESLPDPQDGDWIIILTAPEG